MWLVSLAWAAPTLVLGSGLTPDAWSAGAAVAGLVLSGGDGDEVAIFAEGGAWFVEARHAGTRRRAAIAPPVSPAAREDALHVGRSLLKSLKVPTPVAAPGVAPVVAEAAAPRPAGPNVAPGLRTASRMPSKKASTKRTVEPSPPAGALVHPTLDAARLAVTAAKPTAPVALKQAAPLPPYESAPWTPFVGARLGARVRPGTTPSPALGLGFGVDHRAVRGLIHAESALPVAVVEVEGARQVPLDLGVSAGWAPPTQGGFAPRVLGGVDLSRRWYFDADGFVDAAWMTRARVDAGVAWGRFDLGLTVARDLGPTVLRGTEDVTLSPWDTELSLGVVFP